MIVRFLHIYLSSLSNHCFILYSIHVLVCLSASWSDIVLLCIASSVWQTIFCKKCNMLFTCCFFYSGVVVSPVGHHAHGHWPWGKIKADEIFVFARPTISELNSQLQILQIDSQCFSESQVSPVVIYQASWSLATWTWLKCMKEGERMNPWSYWHLFHSVGKTACLLYFLLFKELISVLRKTALILTLVHPPRWQKDRYQWYLGSLEQLQ